MKAESYLSFDAHPTLTPREFCPLANNSKVAAPGPRICVTAGRLKKTNKQTNKQTNKTKLTKLGAVFLY